MGHITCYDIAIQRKALEILSKQETVQMKGYNVEAGYMGYVDGVYILFADENDYYEYMEAA